MPEAEWEKAILRAMVQGRKLDWRLFYTAVETVLEIARTERERYGREQRAIGRRSADAANQRKDER